MRLRTAAIALAIAGCVATPASAAPWKRVTSPDGASTDQVGLARTGDGVLHLAWSHPTGPKTEDLLHTAIGANGRIGATSPIQSGWTGFTNAAMVIEPGGLRVFWGGFRSTDTNDPQREINTALSPDGGATWALQPGQVNPGGAQSYASNISATVRGDGTTMQAFAGTLGTWVHAGLSPATPNFDYQAPFGPYGYEPNLTTDGSGRSALAWFSSGTSRPGVLVQFVAADGSPSGEALTMPGTSGMAVGMLGRTPLAALGPNPYVAYPTPNRIRVWRVGATNAPVIGRIGGSGSPAVAIAPTADGRLWILWTKGFGDPDVYARRTNIGARRFGAVVNAGHPRDAAQAYKLDASAAGGALDVLGNFNIGNSTTAVTSYRRIRPGLTLKASPSRVRRGRATDVRFTVLDAGDPVRGARVAADGRAGTTNSDGRVTLSVTSRRPLTAKATRSGYTGAKKRLGVRR
ncbi:MAG TPA: hypothetical protein VJT68_01035 [Thermoleophilaceae bacterium]|nr:hypothetical protein [Thermoleophilaceae bacterium]